MVSPVPSGGYRPEKNAKKTHPCRAKWDVRHLPAQHSKAIYFSKAPSWPGLREANFYKITLPAYISMLSEDGSTVWWHKCTDNRLWENFRTLLRDDSTKQSADEKNLHVRTFIRKLVYKLLDYNVMRKLRHNIRHEVTWHHSLNVCCVE